MNKTYIIIAIILLGVLIFYWFYNRNKKIERKETIEKDQQLKYDIVLFYSVRCNACTLAKPQWEETKKLYTDMPIYNFTEISDENEEGMKIMMIHIDAITGDIIKFEKKSLFDFVKPMGK
jgi:hypothetical protein